MIESRFNLALVGAVVVGAVVSLLVVLAVLAGRAQRTDIYYTEYSNVTGLKFGSLVMFEGYPVGQVKDIEPVQDDGKTFFRVAMAVIAGWRIPEDSRARSVAPGVLAPQMIEIAAGDSTVFLSPGDTVRPAESADLLSSISLAADNFDQLTDEGLLPVLDNINLQISRVGQMLDTQVSPLVGDAGIVVGATAANWPEIMSQINVISANLAVTSERFNVLLSDERIASLDRLLTNADQTAVSLANASRALEALLTTAGPDLQAGAGEFRYLMETLSRYSGPIAQSLDSSARNMEEFSSMIRQNPSLLISSPELTATVRPPLQVPEQ